MKIRKASTEELKELAKLYKEAFPVHNIFQRTEKEVFNYLETLSGEILVAVEGKKILGGLALVYELSTPEHKRARLKHIAVAKDAQRKGIGSKLLKEAEKLVEKGKIEIHASENEKEALEFYKKNGYEVEGELKSHYRPNETCYILGKVI